jgi:hypothetical protein
MFLIDMSQPALFARKPPKEEKKPTLRQRIVGTTNAGKAFRVGALASGLGLGYLALKNKGKLAELKKSPKDFFSKPVGEDYQEMIWQRATTPDATTGKRATRSATRNEYEARKMGEDPNWEDKSSRFKPHPKQDPSFLNSGRKVNWGRVGKVVGIGGTALALPTGLAYAAGSKKDKEDIERRTNKTVGGVKSTARDIRTWVNTLHRVSR